MTNKEVCEILNTIKDAYQNFKLDEGVVKTWSMIFSEYEYEPILASLKKYLKTNEYCPVPASIIKLYDEGKAKLNKAIGENTNELVGLLTFMSGNADVFEDVNFYKKWANSIPEINRMQKSAKMINSLKKYGREHLGESFDFKEWLKNYKGE